jgi:propanol-preferring alcohol dehydrogenase
MRAMLLRQTADIGTSPLRLEELPAPVPGPGELRMRVLCCGLCHTDLHVIEGDLPNPALPLIPGHQVVGTVDAIGAGVTEFSLGERAGIAWLRWTDGTCHYCEAGQENLCEHARFTGYQADGGYADYAVAPAAFVYKLPSDVPSPQLAPLLCAGIIGYRALRLTGVTAGDRLGLYGFGGSAHLTIQVARSQGVEVLVFTRSRQHQDLARELGAIWAGGATDEAPAALDAAIIFAPAGSLVPPALEKIRTGGTLVLAGISMSDIPALPYASIYGERVIRSVANNTREDAREFLRLAESIPLHAEVEMFDLADANIGLQELSAGRIRAAGVLVVSD